MTMEEKLKKKYGIKRYQKLFGKEFRESVRDVEKVRKILDKVKTDTLDDVVSEVRYGGAKTKE